MTFLRNHIFFFTIAPALILLTLMAGRASAAHLPDQRCLARGPDGITYVLTRQMDMMGRGMYGSGMEYSLYAVSQDNRVLWSLTLEGGEATAPVVSADSTVYVILSPMHVDGHERQPGARGDKSRLLAIRAGHLKWTFEFEGRLPSAPVPGPRNTIYFSTNCSLPDELSGPEDMDQCETNGGALYAVEDSQRAAVLQWSYDLDAMMVSEPIVRVIGPMDWAITVSGLLRTGGMGGGMMGLPALFQFQPDGSCKTIRLAQRR